MFQTIYPGLLIIIMFVGLVLLSGIKKYLPQEPDYQEAHEQNKLAGAAGENLTPEEEKVKKLREDKIQKILRTKVGSQVECLDPEFPHFNPETSTCVQCFESSFNCLTGFQRCLAGRCVKKNSPQCSYYPVGVLGGSITTPNKIGAL